MSDIFDRSMSRKLADYVVSHYDDDLTEHIENLLEARPELPHAVEVVDWLLNHAEGHVPYAEQTFCAELQKLIKPMISDIYDYLHEYQPHKLHWVLRRQEAHGGVGVWAYGG